MDMSRQDGGPSEPLVAIICADSIVAQDLSDLVQSQIRARVAIFAEVDAGTRFVRDTPRLDLVVIYKSRQALDTLALSVCNGRDCHVILIADAAPDGWITQGEGRHHFVHDPFNARMLARALQNVSPDLASAARPSSPE